MAFWGVEVRPAKPYAHSYDEERGRLRICQATLGNEVGKGAGKSTGKSVVQCSVGDNSPILLCSLIPNVSVTCHLELEFEEDGEVIFSVAGPRSVHLSGYFLGSNFNNGGDETDSYGEDIAESDSEASDASGSFDSEGEYDSDDFIDDGDFQMFQPSPQRKSGVIIEEIPEDDKPADGEKDHRGSKKLKVSGDDDNSQRQLVVKSAQSASLESEDEDGFPISFSASKKSTDDSSKRNRNTNDATSNEDRKRKSDAISGRPDSARPTEERAENDGLSKKNKKIKDRKMSKTDSKTADGTVHSEQERSEKDHPVGVGVDVSVSDAKSKKKKKDKAKKGRISDGSMDQDHAAQPEELSNDKEENSGSLKDNNKNMAKGNTTGQKDDIADNTRAEEITPQEAKKKKKKKKNKQEKDVSKSQAPADLMESQGKKQPTKTRTFGNGLQIEELSMGKPDGKRASPGSRVFVHYIGKLKNGTIFDSNVGQRPFKFRLGVGQVIKGWDVGVNGMRVGDKRRLTIPPSMGYGDQAVGKIPKNSTLVFDVELVNVQ